jgi:transcriptional regulator
VAVGHAHGIPKKIEDPEWLLQHLNELTDAHERDQKLPWKVSDAPIVKLTGKWKLGQNRSDPNQLGTIAGLMSSDGSESHGLANLLNRHVLSGDEG